MFAGTGTLDGCGEEFCRGSKGICRKCTLSRRAVVVQDAALGVRVCVCVWGWPQPKTTIATIPRKSTTTDFIDVSPDYCGSISVSLPMGGIPSGILAVNR